MLETLEPLAVTAMHLIGIKTTKLYELLSNGELARRHIGRRTLVTMESVKRFVASLKD